MKRDELENDWTCSIIEKLTSSIQPDLDLRSAAALQASVLEFNDKLLGSAGNAPHLALAHLVVQFWRGISDKRGFALSSPNTLRTELSAIPEGFERGKDAAKVLLALEFAVGAQYSSELRDRLRQMASPS